MEKKLSDLQIWHDLLIGNPSSERVLLSCGDSNVACYIDVATDAIVQCQRKLIN